jgi:hypothetical protein
LVGLLAWLAALVSHPAVDVLHPLVSVQLAAGAASIVGAAVVEGDHVVSVVKSGGYVSTYLDV